MARKAVCIFCASSNRVDPFFWESGGRVGRLLAEHGIDLVYGGGKVGLMGSAALAAHQKGGRVIGVIPRVLMSKEVAYTDADELIITENLYERKEIMIDRSDAFLVLPGGFGTLDELMEVITLKQLGYHQKPIWIFNPRGYYDRLIELFHTMERERFAPEHQKTYYQNIADETALSEVLGAFFGN